jgi:asparagine synthase (glutamine-hydrolysing)
MTRTLRNRGPDDEGIYVNRHNANDGIQKTDENLNDGPFIGLGHRRLSIIDLSGGHQPIHNEDKRIWIVYNGEIYNFKKLRADLKSKNHVFYTSTDTEVIVHLYEEYGETCVDFLRGMFAFAIWDEDRNKLFIGRDRLGKKPLYYYWDETNIVFASELKAILACPWFQRDINIDGLLCYLQFGYIPDPLSIFQNVFKLPPAHTLTVEQGRLSLKEYWDVHFKINERTDEQEIYNKLLAKIKESVRLRLISDVPLGAFLSGGIDSSTIVALMAGEMTQPVKTFSIGFQEPEFNEIPYARRVSEIFGTEHHEMVVRPESFDLIEKIVMHFDEPFGDPSAIPTYYVSKLASQFVKVVLSGDGGDELFAGYDSYAEIMNQRIFERLPTTLKSAMRVLSKKMPTGAYGKNFLYHISLPTDERFINYVSHVSTTKNHQLLSSDLLIEMRNSEFIFSSFFDGVRGLEGLSWMQYADMKTYLPGDILVKVDRMSMAHSLETRVPLLDQNLVEFVNSLPSKYKMNGKTRKYILKKIASKLLPDEILHRKKQGFAVPLKYWFKGELKDYIRDIIFDQHTIKRGYFDTYYLTKLVKEHDRGRRDHSVLLWHFLILELWHRLYIDN